MLELTSEKKRARDVLKGFGRDWDRHLGMSFLIHSSKEMSYVNAIVKNTRDPKVAPVLVFGKRCMGIWGCGC